jgi:hypothetical protein
MQEVLSRSEDTKTPLSEQEFYELRLYDSDSAGEPVYCVREARAWWNEDSKQEVWDEPRIEVFATLQEAKTRYSERRLALAQLGFIHSDMDLF